MYIQHSLVYAVWNFHLNWLTFLEAMTDVLGVHFLSGHSVYTRWGIIIYRTPGFKQHNLVNIRVSYMKISGLRHYSRENTESENYLYFNLNFFCQQQFKETSVEVLLDR